MGTRENVRIDRRRKREGSKEAEELWNVWKESGRGDKKKRKDGRKEEKEKQEKRKKDNLRKRNEER